MKNVRQDLLSILIKHVYSGGLISKSTYLKAEDLVHSGIDLPEIFRYPACEPAGECDHEYPEDPQ